MEDKYAKALLEKVHDLEIGLRYYIDKSKTLEQELKTYQAMYENRAEEYLKVKWNR